MALLDREDIGRGRTQVDPIGTGETNSAAQYAAVDNIEALTLPVFTVVDEGLISAEMCQDVSPATAHETLVSDNKLGLIALPRSMSPRRETIKCAWSPQRNLLVSMPIQILASTISKAWSGLNSMNLQRTWI